MLFFLVHRTASGEMKKEAAGSIGISNVVKEESSFLGSAVKEPNNCVPGRVDQVRE